MTVPFTKLHALRLLGQVESNLTGLQRDMRQNAQAWKAMAQAQSPNAATIAGYMNTAAAAYQTRLGWLGTLKANTVVWAALADMWAFLGGTNQDFQDLIDPITTVANGIGPANKNTFAQIIAGCDQILNLIDAPVSLWPE